MQAKAIQHDDVAEVGKEVEILLKVKCGQVLTMDPGALEHLTTLSFLMPKVKDIESNTLLSNVSLTTAVHFSEQ